MSWIKHTSRPTGYNVYISEAVPSAAVVSDRRSMFIAS